MVEWFLSNCLRLLTFLVSHSHILWIVLLADLLSSSCARLMSRWRVLNYDSWTSKCWSDPWTIEVRILVLIESYVHLLRSRRWFSVVKRLLVIWILPLFLSPNFRLSFFSANFFISNINNGRTFFSRNRVLYIVRLIRMIVLVHQLVPLTPRMINTSLQPFCCLLRLLKCISQRHIRAVSDIHILVLNPLGSHLECSSYLISAA